MNISDIRTSKYQKMNILPTLIPDFPPTCTSGTLDKKKGWISGPTRGFIVCFKVFIIRPRAQNDRCPHSKGHRRDNA